MTGIKIGVHKDGDRETLCFMIEKINEVIDISYIKAVNGLVQKKENSTDQETLESMFEAVNGIIDVFLRVLEDNPLMIGFIKEKITEMFPHKTSEIQCLRYFLKNLLVLTEKFWDFETFAIKLCVEKILEIECEGDNEKLDNLLCLFLEFLHKNYSKICFSDVLSVFKSHILSTYQTNYIQHIIYNFCFMSHENCELFLSLLVKEVFSHSNINSATSYIISFLLIFSDFTIITLKFLIYYCLKNVKKKSKILNVKNVLKYVFFLLSLRPELLEEAKIKEKITKLVRLPLNLLKEMPLQKGTDYGEILKMGNYYGDLCFTSLYLPFHCEVQELKLCSSFCLPIKLCLPHKKRNRFMSIDDPKDIQIKRRTFSVDETKFFEKGDGSSIATVASLQ